MNKFAGNTATNKTIIPHAEKWVKKGRVRRIPKVISATPLKKFNNLGFEK
jgi:hypothetical protein